MAFIHKPSQPRKAQLGTALPALPADAPDSLKKWFGDLKGAIDEDRETIEAEFAALRKRLDETVTASDVTEQISQIPSVTPVVTSNQPAEANDCCDDSLTSDQLEALKGTYGTPGKNNRFVTERDTQLQIIHTGGTIGIPTGSLFPFAGSNIPDGWLECNGAEVDRFSYANLYTAIGDTWGTPADAANFVLPDFRGRALIGDGTGAGLTARTLGQTGGVESVLLTAAQSGVPAHQHELDFRESTSAAGSDNDTGTVLDPTTTNRLTDENDPEDAAEAHTNMMPFGVVKWIIKY